VEVGDELTHVAIEGRLDVKGVSDVEQEFAEQLSARGKSAIVDISGLDFIASLGMGMLIKSAQALQKAGASMVLLNPTETVARALTATGIDKVLPIAANRDEAVKLLGNK